MHTKKRSFDFYVLNIINSIIYNIDVTYFLLSKIKKIEKNKSIKCLKMKKEFILRHSKKEKWKKKG